MINLKKIVKDIEPILIGNALTLTRNVYKAQSAFNRERYALKRECRRLTSRVSQNQIAAWLSETTQIKCLV